jgi:tetratricopeptide (TPR) repeat protein
MEARFRHEIELQNKLGAHPQIVAVKNAGQFEGRYYLMMDYVPGVDLGRYVAAHGPLPWQKACAFIRQAALGLAHAHDRGVVHRDVKPRNLIGTEYDGSIKILDWGLARWLDRASADEDARLTEPDRILGTPDYIAPEQISNSATAGPASDLYSLGCTLYELLTGRPPFHDHSNKLMAHLESPIPALQPQLGVPEGVECLLRRLLAKRAEDRYGSAREFEEALGEAVGEQSSDPQPGRSGDATVDARRVSRADLPTPLRSESFIGREEEFKKLDDAWEAETCRVVTVVGGWGMGKSALINEWLNRLKEVDYRGAEWVFGWSFRGQGSGEHVAGDSFFHQALSFFKDPNPDFGLELVKEIRLRTLIENHPGLLVLDGLEPLQRPVTAPVRGGQITNEALRRLILHLATQRKGLCVITSRDRVQDLEYLISEGQACEIRLRGLDLEEAVRLLKKRGLKGPEVEFYNASQAYKTNPLSLSLLAAVLERCYQGKIERWREVAGHPDIEKILDPLVANLSSEERAVMNIVSLFDGPAASDAVQAVFTGAPIPGLTDGLEGPGADGWVAAVNLLRELHLLDAENKYRPSDLDCHPEVRAYFAKQLQRDEPAAWREGHLRLYQHFKNAENLSEENPTAIDNLYLAIHHGCKAGHHAEVFDELVWERMSAGFALKRINGHGASARDEMILKYFIRDPFNSEPQCAIEGLAGVRRARLFLWAALVLYVLGRVQAAVKFAKYAQQLFGQTEDRLGIWFCSGYLSWFLAAEGNLDRALKLSERCDQDVNRELKGETLWPVCNKIGLCLHACMLAYRGEFDKALELYDQATGEKCDLAPDAFDADLGILRFHYARLLLKRGSYKEAETEGWELVRNGQGSPVLRFLGYQVLGRMELQKFVEGAGGKRDNPSLGDARKYLDQGKDYLNLGPAYDQIIVNALFMARFNRLGGNLEEADHCLERAEEAVGPFVLLNMDCLLERAWLCLAQGQIEKAREKWTTVSSLANSHGYHYIDDELKELEKQLGRSDRG